MCGLYCADARARSMGKPTFPEPVTSTRCGVDEADMTSR